MFLFYAFMLTSPDNVLLGDDSELLVYLLARRLYLVRNFLGIKADILKAENTFPFILFLFQLLFVRLPVLVPFFPKTEERMRCPCLDELASPGHRKFVRTHNNRQRFEWVRAGLS